MNVASSRDILATNLSRQIEASGKSLRAWAQGKGLDVKLVERLSKNSHAVTLDKLEEIAAAIGVQAWQLLIPDLDVSDPPAAPISESERAMLSKLRKLLDEQPPGP